MLAAIRREHIKEIVQENKSASVVELASLFDVTDETIRRDLKALEKEGALQRSYGGAFIRTGVDNLVKSQIRTTAYVESKKAIAQKCQPLIHNGDTVFLDNSTTSFYLAKQIKDMRITVLTNNLPIINLCATSPSIHLISIGGDYSPEEKAFYGNIAVNTMRNYYVDKAFLSARSLSLENGITDSTDQWTLIRRTALEHAELVYLIADYSKFGHTSFAQLCDYDEIDGVITDKPLDSQWHSQLERAECQLIDQ